MLPMSPQAKQNLSTAIKTTVIGGLILLAASKLAGQVVLRPEYEAHVRASAVADSLQLDVTLEVLCEVKPSSRKCR